MCLIFLLVIGNLKYICIDSNKFCSICIYFCVIGYDIIFGMLCVCVCMVFGIWRGFELSCIGK